MKILDKPVKIQEEQPFISAHIQTVQKYSLDSLIEKFNLPYPQSIKIDVDGSEEKLLKGAKNTFNEDTLTKIFIEIAESKSKSYYLIRHIKKFGFCLKDRTQVRRYKGLYNCIFERL